MRGFTVGETVDVDLVSGVSRYCRSISLHPGGQVLLGHHNIDTRHLLIGLLREDEGVAAGVLKSMGVNEERVRGEVARLSQDSE